MLCAELGKWRPRKSRQKELAQGPNDVWALDVWALEAIKGDGREDSAMNGACSWAIGDGWQMRERRCESVKEGRRAVGTAPGPGSWKPSGLWLLYA